MRRVYGDKLVNLTGYVNAESGTYKAGAPVLKARLDSPPIRTEVLLRILPVAISPARAKARFHILHQCRPSLVSLSIYASKVAGAHEPHADVPSNRRNISWTGRGSCGADLIEARKSAPSLMVLKGPCSSLKRNIVTARVNAGKATYS